MAKNSIRRTQAAVQRADEVGMLQEEHIVIDNNPMPTAEELSKYKDISPELVHYLCKSLMRSEAYATRSLDRV